MSGPLTIFPDPILATLEVLRATLPDFYPDAVIGTVHPEFQETGGPGLPYVRVALDGTFGQHPVTQEATVRVQVYDAHPSEALAIAQLTRGLLLAHEGGTKLRSFGALTGPILTTDPDSATPLAYVTVSARLRPEPLE